MPFDAVVLPKISELDSANPECKICNGEGWVCEDHPQKAWDYGDGCCSGAGMPCECNPLGHWK